MFIETAALDLAADTEVGWVLRRDAWGHGYATEAGRACVEWGFAEFAVPYLMAMIHHANGDRRAWPSGSDLHLCVRTCSTAIR